MKTCNHDCFNCIYDDCITNKITKDEAKEIRERDYNYFVGGCNFPNGRRKNNRTNKR